MNFLISFTVLVPVIIAAIFIIKVVRDNKKSNYSNCPYKDNNTYR